MSSEINEIAVFTAVTAVGLVCAAIVDATPVAWLWSRVKQAASLCCIASLCFVAGWIDLD
jgi:hypothetical protein